MITNTPTTATIHPVPAGYRDPRLREIWRVLGCNGDRGHGSP